MNEVGTVKLPLKVWGRLATIAAERHVGLDELLIASVRNLLRPEDRRRVVLDMARAGYSDVAIAEATFESVNFVRTVRRSSLGSARPIQVPVGGRHRVRGARLMLLRRLIEEDDLGAEAIARQVGCHANTVRNERKRMRAEAAR